MEKVRTNAEVAAVFEGIAELLAQQGENTFKIRAYRSAVAALQSLSEPVSDIAQRGKLRELPGFGEAIAAKTQEILLTGTCALFERLKAEEAARQEEAEEDALDSDTALDDEDMP